MLTSETTKRIVTGWRHAMQESVGIGQTGRSMQMMSPATEVGSETNKIVDRGGSKARGIILDIGE